MKTIAELGAEIIELRKLKVNIPLKHLNDLKILIDLQKLKSELETLQSLSLSIDLDMAGCEEEIEVYNEKIYYAEDRDDIVLCKNVPLEQKCPSCQRLLRFKKEMEG